MSLFLEGEERHWQSLTLPHAIRDGTHSMLVFTLYGLWTSICGSVLGDSPLWSQP